MRLHHLSVTAFGPFAGTVEVDFDAVGLAGLFLIQGPTGAGKTSLLDAICFGLYAGVPGARQGGRSLRSDHAERDVVPRVCVDFSSGTRRFRVTRSPEFMRPKRRGSGETRTPAMVVLEEHVLGRWVVRSTRADEVGEIVTEVLGMGLAQFSKVVLLPQGEFAAFLRSTADERRALLERLFDISTYAGVEGWLVEQRRVRASEVAASRAVLGTDLARLADVVAEVPSGVLDTVPDWVSIPLEDLPAALDEVRLVLATDAAGALTRLDAADAASRAAEQARADAERVADRQRRGAAARSALALLDDDGAAHREKVDRLDAATRADAVAGDLRASARVCARLKAVTAELEAARDRLTDFDMAGGQVAAVQGWVDSLTEHDSGLAEAVRATRGLTGLQGRIREVSSALETARAQAAAQAALATARVALHAGLVAAQTKAHAAQGDAESTLREVERLEQVQRLRLDLRRAAAAAELLGDLVRVARDAEQDARDGYQQVQQARLDGMAGELARTLVDGQACAVCGALEHPVPASDGDAVTVEDVAAAELRWQQCRSESMAQAAKLTAQQQLVATRTEDLVEDETVQPLGPTSAVSSGAGCGIRVADLDDVQLSDALQGATARLGEARRQAARLASATSGVLHSEQEQAQLVSRSQELLSQVAAHLATRGELTAQLMRVRAEVAGLEAAHAASCPCLPTACPGPPVDDQAGPRVTEAGSDATDPTNPTNPTVPTDSTDSTDSTDPGSLTRTRAHHARVLHDAGGLLAALSACSDVLAEQVATDAGTLTSLTANGFPDPDQARAAALPADAVRELRRHLKAVDDQRAGLVATLADEHVRSAMDQAPVDVEATEVGVVAARAGLRLAQQRQTLSDKSDRAFGHLAVVLAEQVRALGPAAAAADQLADLADTVAGLSGNNSMRMRLTSFVLAARLEKVAVLANERLGIMGDGRYQLQHSDDLAAGGRRSGLGLVVRDLWTGQVRDTSSLSGGESFMASLALALGLADAVREEAGGFDLQTLFIDEGFGTLDEESLEQVLTVLDGLREGGRAVGVVSHVSDLRTRIPAQISVIKQATGSSVRIVGVDAPAA